MKYVACTFWILAVTVRDVLGSGDCRTLDGKWYNQLGSEMILNHTTDGELIGQYRTGVERHDGAAGDTHSMVIGASPYDIPGATVAFAVMFNNGNSISSWTGQCLVCDGEEVLVSSWLLRTSVHSCFDKWMSTRIGQDYFTRTPEVPGPRKEHGTSVPSHTAYDRHERDHHSQITKRSTFQCILEGNWYNELGSEVILHHRPDNSITGEYRTAVERTRGAAGSKHSKVYGLGNVYSSSTTFALFVVWNEGASVTGWVGQCHVCDGEEVLEVNWLLRSSIDSCDDNWKATTYGQNSFTRHEQREGPRKALGIHTPQQEGEGIVIELTEDLRPCSGSQTIKSYLVQTLFLLSMIYCCLL